MPNHVANRLTIIGDEKEIRRCLDNISGYYYENGQKSDDVRRIDFEKIIPMPDEIRNTTAPNRDEKLARKLTKKYGHSDWYSWSCAKWGTKWNAYDITSEEYDEPNSVSFSTAWSTPRPVILELSKQYPSLTFEVIYADEDWGHNYGTYTYSSGEIIQDECYDASQGDPEEIVRELQGAPWYEEEGFSSYSEWLAAQDE